MKKNACMNESMVNELNTLLTGEHANAIKALVFESVNAGYKKGVACCLGAIAVGILLGTSAVNLSKSIISKYQKV